MAVEFSGTESELRTRVRANLGGLSPPMLKDSVIDEQYENHVEPWIADKLEGKEDEYDQGDIDTAIVTFTAEKAYKSIPMKSTISGGGLTANMAVSQYLEELESSTSQALNKLDIQRPDTGAAAFATRTDGLLR